MKISHNLRINFWIRKTQAIDLPSYPTIYCRISLGNQKCDISTNHKTNPAKWSKQNERIKDTNLESQQINSYLDELATKIIQTVVELRKTNEIISLEKIKYLLFKKPQEDEIRPKGVRYVMEKYIVDLDVKYKANLLANSTIRGYKGSLSNLNKFLKYRNNKGEVKLSSLNKEFFYDFETFLLSKKNHSTNHAYKVIKHIRHMFNFALDNGWIDQKVDVRFNVKYVNPPRPLLTLEQLKKLKNHQFEVYVVKLKRTFP